MGGQGSNLWYVGVLLEIVSTMSGTIGKQLIRYSELKRVKNPRVSRISMVTGLIVNTAVGPIVDTGAYSFAAQSLIAPFGGLDVVWNALLAPCLLNEKLTPRRTIGCVLILLGTVMAGCFGNHNDIEYTLESLEDTLLNLRVLIYFCVFFVWFLVNRQCLMKHPKGSAIRGISLGCTAGTIAGNMFCVKATIELIQTSIRDQQGEIWLHWLPYCLLAGAVFFALTNVIYMTQGLQEFEALFMVTIYEGSMIVSGCVSGAVVLLDLRGVEEWRVALYGAGILIIVAGMYVIFSQEAMSKSSFMAGTASIKPGAKTTGLSLNPRTVQERSLHAALVLEPSKEILTRSNSDPLPGTLTPTPGSVKEEEAARSRAISDSACMKLVVHPEHVEFELPGRDEVSHLPSINKTQSAKFRVATDNSTDCEALPRRSVSDPVAGRALPHRTSEPAVGGQKGDDDSPRGPDCNPHLCFLLNTSWCRLAL